MQVRHPQRYEKWSAIMREWEATGLSAAEFCRRREIKCELFYAWKRRLADRAREEKEPVGFVPVSFAVDDGDDGCGVTVGVGDGVRLMLSRGFDEGELVRAVRALHRSLC